MLINEIRKILKSSAYISVKLEHIIYEIKLAFQRFWRGYDDSMVWGMNDRLLELIKALLLDLRDNHYGYPVIKDDIESDKDYTMMLNRLIYCIEMTQYYDDLYDENWTTDDYINAEEQRKKYQDEFFETFSKYYDTLWD